MKQSDDIFVLDDRHQIFNLYKSQCATCHHYDWDNYSCQAFPDGIPDAILRGDKQHNSVVTGQIGAFIYIHRKDCLSNN